KELPWVGSSDGVLRDRVPRQIGFASVAFARLVAGLTRLVSWLLQLLAQGFHLLGEAHPLLHKLEARRDQPKGRGSVGGRVGGGGGVDLCRVEDQVLGDLRDEGRQLSGGRL